MTTTTNDSKQEVGEKASGRGTNQERERNRWNMPLGKPGWTLTQIQRRRGRERPGTGGNTPCLRGS
ncbi:hypothetical protein GQ42DRAFT_163371 [Ramicandelaber brevisporus]|nr:hypothetical protein GQ42DRAFT_163371 [Ramicandelaber brevisporus]